MKKNIILKKYKLLLIIIFAVPIILSSIQYNYFNKSLIKFKVFGVLDSQKNDSSLSLRGFTQSKFFFDISINSHFNKTDGYSYDIKNNEFAFLFDDNEFNDIEKLQKFIIKQHKEAFINYLKYVLNDISTFYNYDYVKHQNFQNVPISVQNTWIQHVIIFKMLDMDEELDYYLDENIEYRFLKPEKNLNLIHLYIGYQIFIITILISILLLYKLFRTEKF